MSTISKAKRVDSKVNICQGDVFKDVRYVYIDSEDDSNVTIIEFTFPMAIIISQACDVTSMGDIVLERGGKSTKFMPSILMCPIYDIGIAKKTQHLEEAFRELEIKKLDGKDDFLLYKDDIKIAGKDWHYRFHDLTIEIGKKRVLEKAVVDFKHYFTIPASYLMKHRDQRIFHLEDLFAEQITL